MFKKIGIFCLFGLFGCLPVSNGASVTNGEYNQAPQQQLPQYQSQQVEQPRLKVPNSVIVCRSKQCAPTKLSTSKEYIYNTLLHMLDSNARKKALVCEANDNTHACTEEYVSMKVTVGVTPAYMYIDDVKITDISIDSKNTAALDLMLNWNVTYNGQKPVCRPSKTLLYVKNVNNVIMEDNGYTCKMTTIGTSSIKTLFAIDYIDLDYGYIGGYYSIGMSGPAYGGGSGYMILRLPEDISVDPKDFQPVKVKDMPKEEPKAPAAPETPAPETVAQPAVATTPEVQYVPQPQEVQYAPVAQPVQYVPVQNEVPYIPATQGLPAAPVTQELPYAPLPPDAQYAPVNQPAQYIPVQNEVPYIPATQGLPNTTAEAQIPAPAPEAPVANKTPAPNVDTIIRYNHPSVDYDMAKEDMLKQRQKEAEAYAKWKKEQEEALNYEGVKVLPLPLKKAETIETPKEKNEVSTYSPNAENKEIPGNAKD